ncbi:MAG: type I 3-dehydroquinate dehydratase [Bacteroidales bacterium]|nr:MAG: type I 3-dehydroquinate dehydratase [Bacteroidales bacterium]
MTRSDICVAIANASFENILGILEEVGMAEIRIDLLDLMPNQLEMVFASHNNLIATCRQGRYDDAQRASMLLRAINAGAAWVDLEIETSEEWRKPLIDLARSKRCKVIISWHCFGETPSDSELYRIVDSLYSAGADVAKIACLSNSSKDSARLMSLYSKYYNLVAIGMGKNGVISRIASLQLGAPFTFASIAGDTTAPGQVDYLEMEKLINQIEGLG